MTIRGTFRTCAALVCLALPSTAAAQVAPTLTGEYLTAEPAATATSFNCNPLGDSTFTFAVSGVAFGPYPGTFTETGTATIGPQTDEFLPGQFRGPVTQFDAQFSIDSLVGTVSGTKTLIPPTTPVSNVGVCNQFGGQIGGVDTDYTATITTTDGTFTDQGQSLNQQFNICPEGRDCGTSSSGQFHEWFTSQQAVAPAAVTLSPPAAANDVGTSHTVTATVTTVTGSRAANVTVLFTVSGSVSTSGQCTTDAQGQCDFTYQGPAFPGADLITGCADSNSNGQVDTGEPCGDATKAWLLPATTPGQVTGGGWIDSIGGRVAFGFNAESDGGQVSGRCNAVDETSKTHIKCLGVDTLVVVGTHATFFGEATVAGVATNYRIDVDDLGEPGTSDTFKLETDSGYIAAGTLQGGNIQIHP